MVNFLNESTFVDLDQARQLITPADISPNPTIPALAGLVLASASARFKPNRPFCRGPVSNCRSQNDTLSIRQQPDIQLAPPPLFDLVS